MDHATATVGSVLDDLPAFVRSVMDTWQVPGMGVAVARDGEIVFSQGFGRRDVERDLPVTPRTLFAIGSCTKAFTTASLALLADEGKLDWDTPVTTYLPEFALRDPVASARITPRDLVTHRSGLPRHDLAWYGSPAPRRELVERLRYLEPNKDFRSVWQYQNLMYLTAGYLAGRLAGTEWETLVQERIFAPLGMVESTFSVDRSQESDDFARPYQEKDGDVREVPFRNIDALGPAGSINSSIDETGRWLLLHLNGGRHEGERLISEGQIAQMHAPQMVMPDDGRFAEVALPSYGLGWIIESYRGQTHVAHGGNIDGFSALVGMLPRERIGVVVLANLDGVPVPDVVAYHVYDRLLGLDPIPWNDRFLKDKADRTAGSDAGKAKTAAERIPDAPPSHPLDAYAGEYDHPGYGTLAIARDGEGLTLRLNGFAGPLMHHHYDVFEFDFAAFDERARFVFVTDQEGEIAAVSAPLEPTTPDIVFRRRPPAAMAETSFLEQFVGDYDLLGATMTVALKGPHALQVSLPGMPGYELEPRRGTAFRFKSLSDFAVEFKADERGAFADAIITQPDGVFTARRKE